MSDPFAFARRVAARDTADSLEIDRIMSLPVILPPEPEVIEAFCEQEVQAKYFAEGFRLFPTQVAGVLAWDLYGGGFMPIGVGWGKTLITLMIANRAYERGESERSMLFVPPNVWDQLTRTDIPWARKRVGLTVPFHLLGNRNASDRRRIAASGRKGCYLLTYSLLSTRDAEALLCGDRDNPPPDQPAIDGILPDLLIFDEAHRVKSDDAARTARMKRFVTAHQPRMVVLSGTITNKSIRDYHYLIRHALKQHCPLPISETQATDWSYVLDPEKPGFTGGYSSKGGPLTPLVRWARKVFPEEQIPAGTPGFRQAYKLRLNSTPGVVSTGDAEIGVSLTLTNRPVSRYRQVEGWPALEELMRRVEEMWLTPSGDEIEFGFQKWRYMYELTAGFYYHLRWPAVEELVKHGLSSDEAATYLSIAMEHHDAHQEFSRSLRSWIQYSSRPGLDTPLLITSNMARNGARDVGEALYGLWRQAKDLEFEGMPRRISDPIRVCDYKILHAVAWAEDLLRRTKGRQGGLIWFHHDEPGRWLADALKDSGVPYVWCPSESVRAGSNTAVSDPANADKIVVASMGGHGTGRNLQHFEHQAFMQFPRGADLLEQVLGRTHRNGQEADELDPVTFNTTDFDHQNMWACLIESLYIHQTTGARQKAIYATYDPLPRRYPEDFLRERGFVDLPQLDAKTRAALAEKFGETTGALSKTRVR